VPPTTNLFKIESADNDNLQDGKSLDKGLDALKEVMVELRVAGVLDITSRILMSRCNMPSYPGMSIWQVIMMTRFVPTVNEQSEQLSALGV